MKKDRDTKKEKMNTEEVKDIPRKPAKNENIVSGYRKDDLNDELERLAQLFRDELKNQGELEEEEEYLRDERGIIYEDEVCECCGEKRKAKDSEYCKTCQEAMRHYPFSIPMVVVAVVIVVFAVISAFDFANDFDGYYVARKAKEAVKDREMYSAIDYYNEAIEIFDADGTNAKKLKFECADSMYQVMAASEDILLTLSSALDGYEATLPMYTGYVELYDEVYVLRETMNMMFDIYNDEAYADAAEDEEVYEKAMTAIGALKDEEITVPSLDGESRKYMANEAAVRYCQYTYAYLMGNTDDVYYYVNETYKLAPEYLCMYGYDLGTVCAQTRDFNMAFIVADVLYKNNVEDATSYCIYSSAERMRGNYDKAVEWAVKGIEKCPGDAELMRIHAMALIAKGECESAKEIVDTAFSYESTDLLYAVSLVVENELGNTEAVEELKTKYEEADVEIPDRVQQYLDGKITAKQLFTEGTGEV